MTDSDGDPRTDAGSPPDTDDAADAADGRTEGTFLVTAAEDDSAVLRNVETGQVHTLSSNPGVDRGDVVQGTVAPAPPMNVSYRLVRTHSPPTAPAERSLSSPHPPPAPPLALPCVGDLSREPRAGTGEIHVLTVPEDGTDDAVADLLDDADRLRSRAARLGVDRVEIRSEPGVVSVRYLP